MDAGGKRFRPLLVLLAAQFGDPDRRRRAHRGVRRRADPPRDAVPRRRDGRGRPAPRRRVGQRPLGQPRRDPHRRLPVRPSLRPHRRPRPGGRPDPGRRRSPGSSRARSARRSGPRDGEDPLAHYLRVVADKTGSLIATSARFGAHVRRRSAGGRGGAHGVRREDRRRLPALRRHPRRRLGVRRVRQDAGHRPARGRADAAGADRPALRPTRPTPGCCELLAGPTHRRRACTPRRSPCCARTRRWPRPAPTSSAWPPRPRTCSRCCPRGRSATALEAFADADRHPHRLIGVHLAPASNAAGVRGRLDLDTVPSLARAPRVRARAKGTMAMSGSTPPPPPAGRQATAERYGSAPPPAARLRRPGRGPARTWWLRLPPRRQQQLVHLGTDPQHPRTALLRVLPRHRGDHLSASRCRTRSTVRPARQTGRRHGHRRLRPRASSPALWGAISITIGAVRRGHLYIGLRRLSSDRDAAVSPAYW